MYSFQIDGENFKANWKYSFTQETRKIIVRDFTYSREIEKTKRYYSGTRCNIYDSKGNLISEGYSLCNKKDTFHKQTGRKLSFHRALENMGLTKDQREGAIKNFLWTL